MAQYSEKTSPVRGTLSKFQVRFKLSYDIHTIRFFYLNIEY